MTVVTYSGPGADTYRSAYWVVKVNGSPVYVYELEEATTLNTRWYSIPDAVSVALVTVATDEDVEITVEPVPGDPDITSAKVYPTRYEITPTVSGGVCSFTLAPDRATLVDLNNPDDDDNAHLLIVRTVALQVTPDEAAPGVVVFDGSQTEAASDETLYFPAGVWDIGQSFRINSRGTVFIDGNAWLKGNFEIQGTVDVSVRGHGNWSGEDFDHAAIRAMPFNEATTYCAIYGYDPNGDNYNFSGNTVEGPASWHPGFYTVANGLSWLRYFVSLAPWWYNVNGFDLSVDVGGDYEAGAEHCLTISGDDNFMHESNYNHYELSDCFFINTASACIHLSYWPLATEYISSTTGTWFYDCTAMSLAIWDEPTETGSIVRSQVDGTLAEGEAQFNRSNVFFYRFHVDGGVDGNVLQAVNKNYQWGDQDQARGQILDFQFHDVTVERTPVVRSNIRGYDWVNTPSDFKFTNFRVSGTLVTHRNFADYFNINVYPYHISFGGRTVTSAVDICNTALSYVGERDRVTSIDPVDGSEESRHCARAYTEAFDELMEMHNWSFNTKKIQLTQINTDSDDTDDPAWPYRYEIPDGMAEALAVLPEEHEDDYVVGSAKQPQDFHIKQSDEDSELRIYSKWPGAWLRYTVYLTDPNQLSRLAVAALTWLVASKIAGTIVRGEAGAAERNRCLAVFGKYLAEAKLKDAKQRQVSAEVDPPWLAGRTVPRNPWNRSLVSE